jgi:hypothetical protein
MEIHQIDNSTHMIRIVFREHNPTYTVKWVQIVFNLKMTLQWVIIAQEFILLEIAD